MGIWRGSGLGGALMTGGGDGRNSERGGGATGAGAGRNTGGAGRLSGAD